MSKAQNALQPSDGDAGRPAPMQDGRFAFAPIVYGEARDEFLVDQSGIEDCCGPGLGSLLSGSAAPKGRRSLFRR